MSSARIVETLDELEDGNARLAISLCAEQSLRLIYRIKMPGLQPGHFAVCRVGLAPR